MMVSAMTTTWTSIFPLSIPMVTASSLIWIFSNIRFPFMVSYTSTARNSITLPHVQILH